MRKLVTVFFGIGIVGIIGAILSTIKWGIISFSEVYLFFALLISGILFILGFFGAWIIMTFDDYKTRLREYKKDVDGKIKNIEDDMASTQKELMEVDSKLIELNEKSFDEEETKKPKLNKNGGNKNG